MEGSSSLAGLSPALDPSTAAAPDLAARVRAALERATKELLAARTPNGHWEGELSSSALSTATAVIALAVTQRQCQTHNRPSDQISTGLAWLANHANADGGWGDTIHSLSNISTTALCWAAFGAVPGADEQYKRIVSHAEQWLDRNSGRRSSPLDTNYSSLVTAIVARYGRDRTFSAPILTACALSGRLGPRADAWRQVLPLPFELAAFPRQWFAALRLPVVSYALPALIAIGQARHFHLPSRNPVARLSRTLTRERTLKILAEIQPGSGGFLEATPLTSFVVMSLAGSGQDNHPVTRKGLEFLLKAQRTDGSWAIDTNLATWVTTLAVNSISNYPPISLDQPATGDWKANVWPWLLNQQYRDTHPYTQAAPGGWAWTDLPGGVPDADDTAGALLALGNMRSATSGAGKYDLLAAARSGIRWLRDVQNRDGGIPTFCQGWGTLPFDRSSADITAHCIRGWLAWLDDLPNDERRLTIKAIGRAASFLASTQRPDGAWAPLWFGNQHAQNEENLTYGTSRVLVMLPELLCRNETNTPAAALLCETAITWLIRAQNIDGGWGGAPGIVSSTEETALAVESLAAANGPGMSEAARALERGVRWLIERVESGEWTRPTPIGFYFAKLWYHEKLYPQVFTVGALGRVMAALSE